MAINSNPDPDLEGLDPLEEEIELPEVGEDDTDDGSNAPAELPAPQYGRQDAPDGWSPA